MFDSSDTIAAPELPLEWSRYAPDGMLADLLVDAPGVLPPASMHPGDAGFETLERVGAWEKIIAWAQANQQADMVRFLRHHDARRPVGLSDEQHEASAAAEIAMLLRVSRRTAENRVATAVDLIHRLPSVHEALASGRISLPMARALAEETTHLPAGEARVVADSVLPDAEEQTAGQLRVATRRAVLRADPDAVRARCEQATRERGVWLQDEPDGMASLHARLPAADAVGCYAVLDEYARKAAAKGGPGMDARRADALVDLIRGVDPGRVKVQVRVTVPYATLLGHGEQPGELAGYGPVPAHIARRLAADGTWRRLLTDPVSGALLDYGSTRYKPPTQLAEHVNTRDQTCRAPGCRVPAHRCDLDHTIPFDSNTGTGPTSADNLSAKCRSHHQLKQHPGWAVRQDRDGTLTWRTPTGHTYRTRPPPSC